MRDLIVSVPDHCLSFYSERKQSPEKVNGPADEIMVLFILRKLILQTSMRSHPVGLVVWFLVGSFVYHHTSCVWTAKVLARLCGCAGSSEPSLVAYVISTIISWAGSNDVETLSFSIQKLFLLRFRMNCLKIEAKKWTGKYLIIPFFFLPKNIIM